MLNVADAPSRGKASSVDEVLPEPNRASVGVLESGFAETRLHYCADAYCRCAARTKTACSRCHCSQGRSCWATTPGGSRHRHQKDYSGDMKFRAAIEPPSGSMRGLVL